MPHSSPVPVGFKRSHNDVAKVLIFAPRKLLPAVGMISVENPCLSNTRD